MSVQKFLRNFRVLINDGCVFRFVEKAEVFAELRPAVEHALREHVLRHQHDALPPAAVCSEELTGTG